MRQRNGLILLFILIVGMRGYLHSQKLQRLPALQPSYSHDLLLDKDGIKVDCIEDAYSDQQGRLWLKTCGQAYNKGIHTLQYDGYHHRFLQAANLENLSAYRFSSLGINSNNQLFGYFELKKKEQEGLFLMDLDTRKMTFQPIPWKGTGDVFDIHQKSDSSYLILTRVEHQMSVLTLTAGKLDTLIFIKDPILPDFRARTPKSIYRGEELWFKSDELPLVRINLHTKSIRFYTGEDFPKELGESRSNTPNYLKMGREQGMQFSVSNSGKVYVWLRGYFFQLDQSEDRFILLEEGFPYYGTPVSLFQDQKDNVCFVWEDANQHLHAVLKDPNGGRFDYSMFFKEISAANLIGVFGNNFFEQVFISVTNSLYHVLVQEQRAIERTMDGYFISSIMELPSGPFLINTVRNGWFELASDVSQFQAFNGPLSCNPNPFTSDQSMVQQIIPDPQDNIWWVKKGVLYRYHPLTGNCDSYDVKLPGVRRPTLFAILENEQFAFHNWANELKFYDLKERQYFAPGGSIPQNFQEKVWDLMVGKENILWIPTSNGLWKIDLQNQSGTRLDFDSSFEDRGYKCVYLDEAGNIWLGTLFSGIRIYNPETDRIEQTITTAQGLTNNSLSSIFADHQGDIWAATENGMNLISPQGEVITSLYTYEGLNDNSFFRFDPFVAQDGRLLIGNQKGLNVIDPSMIKELLNQVQAKRKIFLTELSYVDAEDGKAVQLNAFPRAIPDLHLPADQRNLSVSYGISSYVEPGRNHYAYRLAGIEKEWNYLGAQHTLNLASLPAGEYTLQIKGRDFRNNWSVNMLEIPIYAEEFFYKSLWFYLLCSLPFVLSGLVWIYRMRKEKVKLEATVAARTQQIRKDKTLIENQAEQLRELDQAKSRFFTNISHEFRTPLTIISGMADQIEEKPEVWLKRGIQMIKQNTGGLLNLVNQILDLRKLETKELKLEMVQGDVIKYLRYITESYHSYAENKGLQLHFLSGQPSIKMDFDPDKLLRIVSNLLSNAVKYTPEGGNVYFQIDKKIKGDKAELHLRVQDSGIGIPAEDLPHIFGRFYQVDDSGTRRGEGTGIGLALIKELVKLLGGEIRVESTVGQGTTFHVELPMMEEAEVKADWPFDKSGESTLNMLATVPKKKKLADPETEMLAGTQYKQTGELKPSLLIVEDNPDVQKYLIACLEDIYQLSLADDGQAGIDKAIEQVPDLIVSDVMMPEKDGYELTKTLKNDERSSHIPIILLTAKADIDSRISGLEQGADAYLAKPFEKRELMVRLEKLLELRKKLQARYRNLHPEQAPENKEDEFVQKVRQAVLDNLSDDSFGIAQLCRKIALSRAQLHNKLKALTGQSTSHFIRSIRLLEAKKLLELGDLNVSEVGYEVGFKNPAHFSTAFQEEYGIPPSKTRK